MPNDADLTRENALLQSGAACVAGVDEVGRGAIAGPLVMGAVCVDAGTPLLAGLRDSKLLSPAKRERLVPVIEAWARAYSVGVVHAPEIDALGMAAALRLAARRALDGLPVKPDAVIVDGPVNFADNDYRGQALPKADLTCASVAAASIIAKVWRDRFMAELDARHPGYGLAQHKGYGTAQHYAALDELGNSPQHRLSFKRRR